MWILKLAVAFIAFSIALILHAQNVSQHKKTKSSSIDDRKYWVDLLYKISFPVLDNLAKSTLRKNMPLEKAPGYSLNAEQVSYLEAVGRTLAGLAPWLALEDDNSEEQKLRKLLITAALKGLANAVDPANPDYLNFRKEKQPMVDAAFLAHAFLRAPNQLWMPLDSIT